MDQNTTYLYHNNKLTFQKMKTLISKSSNKKLTFRNYSTLFLSSACLLLTLLVCLTKNSAYAQYRNGAETVEESHHQYHSGRSSNMQQHPKALLQQQQQQQNGANSQTQNRCQSGWMWFNNKCWVTTQSRRDFIHAVELCKKMYNSTLPTIHSEDENEFLRQNIDLHNSPIWLYARHNHQYNKTRWLDKTPVNYTRWDAGQPSDKSSLICIKTEDSWYMKKAEPVDGQTECVSFWEDARWGTQVGCLVLLPVVCERKLTPISRQSEGPNGTINSQVDPMQLNQLSSATSIYNGLKTVTIYLSVSMTILVFNQIAFTKKLHST